MMVTALMSSCEKMVPSESTEVKNAEKANVVLRVTHFEQVPLNNMTRIAVDSVCTRLNFAVYDAEGVRKELVSQKNGEADFGVASLSLEEGDYRLVIVGNSGQNNPSFKSAYFAIVSARAAYYKSFSSYLPTVTASYSLGQTFTKPFNRDAGNSVHSFTSSPSLSANLLLFDDHINISRIFLAGTPAE